MMLPLSAGVVGLVKRTDDKDMATKLVSHELSAFTLFLLIEDCYLLILARAVL
jgi:hypothetical protein